MIVSTGLLLCSIFVSSVIAQSSNSTMARTTSLGNPSSSSMTAPSSSTASSASSISSGNSSSTSVDPIPSTAPTGVIKGDYTGDYRPQVHFSPPTGFMNDPNGCFLDANGTWHLYYQYNPTGLTAGNQHWGHATSPDLYHWTNQPIALFPPEPDTGIFSGCIVVDSNNTSGFFPNQTDGVVAIYTLNAPSGQTQEIAYSYDSGYTFTVYDGNPVLDLGLKDFRDPKVVWYEDHWVMVVARSTEFVIDIYTSTNLKEWTYASNVTNIGLLGLLYECPNLVQVPIWENGSATGQLEWVLIISINPGAPQGGSISQYYPGTFDGYTFVPVDGAARISDFGKDNYAEQFFFGTDPKEAVSIAWASNWQYTNNVPTDSEGWRSIMSLPRINYLTKVERTGWEMGSLPYKIDAVKSSQLSYDGDFANKSVIVDYSNSTSGSIYFEATFDSLVNITTIPTFNITFSAPSSSDKLRAGYIFGGSNAGLAWIDRRKTTGYGDDDPTFTDRFSVAGVALAKTISGVIDRTVIEMFVDEGAFSGTTLFFPEDRFTNITLEAANMPEGAKVTIAVWELSSTWNQ